MKVVLCFDEFNKDYSDYLIYFDKDNKYKVGWYSKYYENIINMNTGSYSSIEDVISNINNKHLQKRFYDKLRLDKIKRELSD